MGKQETIFFMEISIRTQVDGRVHRVWLVIQVNMSGITIVVLMLAHPEMVMMPSMAVLVMIPFMVEVEKTRSMVVLALIP